VRKFLAWLRMNVDLASLLQRRSVLSLNVRFSSSKTPSSLNEQSFLIGFFEYILSIGVKRSGLFGRPISLLLKIMLFGAMLTGFPFEWNIMNFVLDVLTEIYHEQFTSEPLLPYNYRSSTLPGISRNIGRLLRQCS
jgi:hypothetical protein